MDVGTLGESADEISGSRAEGPRVLTKRCPQLASQSMRGLVSMCLCASSGPRVLTQICRRRKEECDASMRDASHSNTERRKGPMHQSKWRS